MIEQAKHEVFSDEEILDEVIMFYLVGRMVSQAT
jgi:hypothetical protein